MNDGYIAVLDSGVGGLSVLSELTKAFPNERFLYFGDNDKAPYGNRTDHDLWSITLNNIIYVLSFNVKALVVACNTLSVTILERIRAFVSVPCFGVFPPVERCLVEGDKTLLISTVKTAEKFVRYENLRVIGLPNLVKDIENNLFSLNKVNIKRHIPNRNICCETLILGCTHYNFVKFGIIDHFRPAKILSGAEFTVKQVENILRLRKSLVIPRRFEVLFVGKNSKLNQIFWEKVVKNI